MPLLDPVESSKGTVDVGVDLMLFRDFPSRLNFLVRLADAQQFDLRTRQLLGPFLR